MSVNFFTKKRIVHFSSVFTILFTFLFVFQAAIFAQGKEVAATKTYYFLLSTEENLEVGTEFAKLDGGAGYLLKEERLAISVYEDEEGALRVQRALASRGKDTEILPVGGKAVVLYGKDRRRVSILQGALKSFEGYISVLNQTITLLEKGTTQQSVKEILRGLTKQFAYAEKWYADSYQTFSSVCKQSVEQLNQICEGIVYAKDLRYLLCWQVERYARL